MGNGTVPDATTALEILDLALVPGCTPPVYAVGMIASRTTMADQQRRAINIIWALVREGRVTSDSTVAIIGGGVAGITAAAYALSQGLRVTVFERFADPFTLQQGSGRWIHPNIYDWPADGWDDAGTNLPCMNWRAGTAGGVVAGLRKEWLSLQTNPALEWRPKTEIVGLEQSPGGATISDSAGNLHGPYSCVVMAAGFGEEPTRLEFDCKPYWRDDDLHQRLRSGGTALVSGCGDGGLIDAVRVAIRDFRHDWLATVASRAAEDRAFISELLRVERNTPSFRDGEALTKAILALGAPPAVTAMISEHLRPGTTVILNSGADGPLTRTACLINRFLIAELIKLGVVSYQPGKLDAAAISRIGTQYNVPIDGTNSTADLVIIRHGAQEHPLKHFPAIKAALEPAKTFLRTYRAGVDRTRIRAWGRIPVAQASATTVELPVAMSDVMAYLAKALQDALKDGLAQKGELAIVSYTFTASLIELRVRIGSSEEQVNITLTSKTSLLIAYPRRSRQLTVTLQKDVMLDSGSAVPTLVGKVPEVIHWILEDYT